MFTARYGLSSKTIHVTFNLGPSSTVTPTDVTKCSHWPFLRFPIQAFPKFFPSPHTQSRELVIKTARTCSELHRRWRGSCVWHPVPSLLSSDVSNDRSAFIFRGLGPIILVRCQYIHSKIRERVTQRHGVTFRKTSVLTTCNETSSYHFISKRLNINFHNL